MASPIEIGIILAQSGLGLLSWSTFVRTGLVSAKTFTYGWKAHGQIRKLLHRARIPTAVPTTTSHLRGSFGGLPPTADAPERLAYVRNRIVHPPREKAMTSQPSPLLIEAWRLSLHYLELSLLRMSRYQGSTWSRVHGDVRPVPWDAGAVPW
jgi:hypothetical protein